MRSQPQPRVVRHKLLLLYLGGLAIYGLLAGPRLRWRTPNEFVALAEALLRGRLSIEPALQPLLDLATYRGQLYVPYPPAPALLYLPLVAAFGRGVYHGLLHVLLAAAVFPLFYLVLRRYTAAGGQHDRELVWLTAALGLGSVFAPLATRSSVYFTGQVVAVLLVCLYLSLARRGRHPLAAGLMLGMAYLARGATLLAAPVALAEIWQGRPTGSRSPTTQPRPPSTAVGLARFAVGLGIILALSAVYNWARFDQPLELGYRYLGWRDDPEITHWGLFHYVYLERNLHAALTAMPVLLPGFPYLTFHPEGMSLLLTTPLLIMLPRLRGWSTTPRVLAISAGLIWLPALFYANTGFVQYGYRYAADWLPLLLLAMAAAGLQVNRWWVKGLILLGIAVCLYGAYLSARHPYTPAFGQLIQERTLLRYRQAASGSPARP